MTKDFQYTPANLSNAPGRALDREAARRASASLQSLPKFLPASSVSNLAQEVISRLAARSQACDKPNHQAEQLADALVSRDAAAGLLQVTRMIASGTDVETVYLKYLTGAARILGERWTDDALTSAQVAIAAARIYAIMRGLSSRIEPDVWPDGRHAVFVPVPGEHHTLGVSMAADLFRRDGWLIDLKVGRSHDELLKELAETDYAILALSASTPAMLPELILLITAVRVTHPHVRILIAGNLVEVEPKLQELTDADFVSNSFEELRTVMNEFHEAVAARAGAALR